MQHTDLSPIPVFARWFGSWQVRIERRPLPPNALAAAYDKAAPSWTRLTERLGYALAYRRIFQEFFSSHRIATGQRPLQVLDCGAGTGGFSLAFAKVWPKRAHITAVDISPAMMAAANRRFEQAGVSARTLQSNIESLPFADRSFDVVIAAHVLEHLSDPVVALAEMRRVLRPGGWVVTCLTRKSWLGAYIQTKWRTHRITHSRSAQWLRSAGLIPSSLDGPGGIFRMTSLAAIGQNTVTDRLIKAPAP